MEKAEAQKIVEMETSPAAPFPAAEARPEIPARQQEPAFTIGLSTWLALMKNNGTDHFENIITRAFLGDQSAIADINRLARG